MLQEVARESAAAEVIREEETILQSVLQRLVDYLAERSKRFADQKPSVYQQAQDALIELRDVVGEARSFDVAAITDQMHHLAALASHQDPKLNVPADPQTPYFAHIRVREEEKERDVLIGKRGFVDGRNRINIVDWRNAPISRLYYTCEEGSDYDILYGEREVEGELLLRRSLGIHHGALRRIQSSLGRFLRQEDGNWYEQTSFVAPELKGGQGTAKRAPSERPRFGTGDDRGYRVDKHLPEIAALIDPEQFERITQSASGLVILQGGAGSGKTTVALHRVAYLNYQNRHQYDGDRVLVTVFTRALARYIQKVLPALDCHNIRVRTYARWAHDLRRQILPHLPKDEWQDVPSFVSRLKKHPALLGTIRSFVAAQQQKFEAEFAQRLTPALQDLWTKEAAKPLVPRLRTVLERCRTKLPDVASELTLQKAYDRAVDIYADWNEILTDPHLLRNGLLEYGDQSVSEGQLQKFAQYCAKQVFEKNEDERDDGASEDRIRAVDLHNQPRGPEDQTGLLDTHDNTILLRIMQAKRGGIFTPEGREIFFRHSVIDEAQDLSPLEIAVIVDATADECVTLAGDTAQKLIFDNGFDTWEGLLRAIGKSAIQIKPLRIGYRSTHEINVFANQILGPLAPSEPVISTRHGAPVEAFRFAETGEAMAFLTDNLRALMDRERQANVALLALTPAVADLYYEGLRKAEIHPLRRVRDQDFTFTPGIDITDISQIKGLEYDYVIVLDATAEHFPTTNESRHLLHIAATRAAHQLWLIAPGAPSPLIPADLLVDP